MNNTASVPARATKHSAPTPAEKERISLFVSAQLKEQLRQAAAASRRTLNAQCEVFLEEAMQQNVVA